ncbi:polysaccharide lyase 6 family protein [Ferruginibacter yonginensis]|uniref:Polysaccharide lyase 6 family protein n=1 Tax=Ferruginibacter yonginensis TaxID=1310416 RepID=A0ABV8QT32_9BACT
MLKTCIALIVFVLTGYQSVAKKIVVKNNTELSSANEIAQPGDEIILQNGTWTNVQIKLSCNGTALLPIYVKAQTQGKVIINGESALYVGGAYIVIDGLLFTDGYAAKNAVINFRINNDKVATHCRVTNTVINDYNNPKRLDENYWIALYGQNNRIDHCSFLNKKNMGVLLAVILNDDRSRKNYHEIDHNYFGIRLPLASNSGEIIRIGVSEHCEFYSNTQITDNLFEHCDGETEIISVKSCGNLIKNNVFKECQGGVVLRHGNNNIVLKNIFYGNNKTGTGGVRIINKGQWVVNNVFYNCIGVGFRSPMSIMNGVPNSPANRYLPVSEVVVANNSFINCTPISFCEGSDAERSVPPKNVQFINNTFYSNTQKKLYNTFDDMSGITFAGNVASNFYNQKLMNGFATDILLLKKVSYIAIPYSKGVFNNVVSDSLQIISEQKNIPILNKKPGAFNEANMVAVIKNAATNCGTIWFKKDDINVVQLYTRILCKTTDDIKNAITSNNQQNIEIVLTATNYNFKTPIQITKNTIITSNQKNSINLIFNDTNAAYLLELKAGKSLQLKNINLNIAMVTSKAFVVTDTSQSSHHNKFYVANAHFSNVVATFFKASKTNVLDTVKINNVTFNNSQAALFLFNDETDEKGYYNVENLICSNNTFNNINGTILSVLRSGKDESTLGPTITFTNNSINNGNTNNPIIHFEGVQFSTIKNNVFKNANTNGTLIQYKDAVRAQHIIKYNQYLQSGAIIKNKYVTE